MTVQGIVTEVRIDITFPNPGSGCSRVDAPFLLGSPLCSSRAREPYIKTGERRESGMMWVSFAEMWDTADIEEVYGQQLTVPHHLGSRNSQQRIKLSPIKLRARKGRGHHGKSILLLPAARCWLAVVDLWTSEVGCRRGERKRVARHRRTAGGSCMRDYCRVTLGGVVGWMGWMNLLVLFLLCIEPL